MHFWRCLAQLDFWGCCQHFSPPFKIMALLVKFCWLKINYWLFLDTYSTYTEIQADACGYWMLLWRLSKIPEYVDTAFLVLRKREVSLMHLWHHISTSMCVFFVWEPYSEYNGLINYFIHGIMYTYFSLSTLGFILPAQFAQFITSIQLIQFFASEFIYSHVAILSLLSPTININFLPWLLSL